MTTTYIGQPISRVDGRAKVTGGAKYAAEHNIPNLVYGCVVSSAVAKGTITRIDAADALGLPGVLQVLTHENAPRLPPLDFSDIDPVASPGSAFVPLQGSEIKFSLQPVALALAESFEMARYAASLVRIEYERGAHVTDFDAARARAYVPPRSRPVIPPPPKPRGDAARALRSAAVQLHAEYLAPVEHHNPMELFGTTVIREPDGKLTVYDKNQGVQNVQEYLCTLFGLSKDDVRVLTPFMGGGFGSGLHPQYQSFLAVMAARALKRSVLVSLTGSRCSAMAIARSPGSASHSAPRLTGGSTRWFTRLSREPRASKTIRRAWSTGRACCTSATTSHSITSSRSSTSTHRLTCARLVPPGVCMRSNVRWTSSP